MAAVNEALNELYTEDEDYEKLRESVDDYDNFDQVCIRWYVFASVRMSNLRVVIDNLVRWRCFWELESTCSGSGGYLGIVADKVCLPVRGISVVLLQQAEWSSFGKAFSVEGICG